MKTIFAIFFLSSIGTGVFSQSCPDITIWTECVEDLGDGRFRAYFSYHNPGGAYSVNQLRSVLIYNGRGKKWDALCEFQPGTHQFVVQRILEGNDRVRWRLKLPGRHIQVVTADSQTDLCSDPVLSVNISGPSSALIGETVEFTYTLTNDPSGDLTPITGISLYDDLTGVPVYQSGDNGNQLLDAGESWTYTAGYRVKLDDPENLTITVTATGRDSNGDSLDPATAQQTLIVNQNFYPGYYPPEGGKNTDIIGPELTSLWEAYQFPGFTASSDDVYQIDEATSQKVLVEIVPNGGQYTNTVSFLSNTYGLSPEPESDPANLSLIVWFPVNSLTGLNDEDVLLNFARPVYPAISNSA